jgi:hypothetical protein
MTQKASITPQQIAIGAVAAFVGISAYPVARSLGLESVLNWIVGFVLLGVVGFVIWVLSQNKGTIKATAEQTQQARMFQPEPGKGVIYVLRHQYMGMLQGLEVHLNSQAIGQTRGYCFYRLVVEPGTHQLSGTDKCPEALHVTVGPGQIAFVEQYLRNDATVIAKYGYEWSADIAGAQQKILKSKMFVPKSIQ